MALDINTATAQELTAIEGVSPELAIAIIEYRDENGGFNTLDEVAEVPGCDEGFVEQLRKGEVVVASYTEKEGMSEM